MLTRQKWPLRVSLLAWLVACFTAWNVVRVATSIAWHDTLGTYAPHPGPLYIGITGATWTLVGFFLLWCLWRGKRWTRIVFLISSGAYAAWFWADRLFVQAGMRANWLFTLVATTVLLALVAVVVLDHRNRIYLEREAYERKP